MRATLELEEPTLRRTNAERTSCGQRTPDVRIAGYSQRKSGTLYRYLEMEPLLEAFTRRLSKAVPIDGLHFRNTPLRQSFDRRFSSADDQSEHLLEFSLGDQKCHLGSLVVTRQKQFLSSEVRRVKGFVDALVGPLGNATMYLCACQSAYLDALTGLQNRAALDDTLSRSPVPGCSAALMVCDVDWFKSINDNCGHKSGDMVLQQFAEILRSSTRDGDLVYRYGGDEFVVILNNSTLDAARDWAEQIRMSIEQTPLHIDNACINLTATIGLTVLKPGQSLDEAFLRADAALLEGKKNGKNRLVCG